MNVQIKCGYYSDKITKSRKSIFFLNRKSDIPMMFMQVFPHKQFQLPFPEFSDWNKDFRGTSEVTGCMRGKIEVADVPLEDMVFYPHIRGESVKPHRVKYR